MLVCRKRMCILTILGWYLVKGVWNLVGSYSTVDIELLGREQQCQDINTGSNPTVVGILENKENNY